MNNVAKVGRSLAFLVLGVGLAFTAGCKSVPPLTQDQALQLIQAHYDQAPPSGINITVNDLGMRQGIDDKYWERTKIYPNKYWADFKLTDAGKKVLTLQGGGDVIQWRPDSMDDKNYSIVVITTVKNHMHAHDIGNVHDEELPGVETAQGATFVEGVELNGVPQPLQDIAHNPGNQLSSERHADFALVNGKWTLQGIV